MGRTSYIMGWASNRSADCSVGMFIVPYADGMPLSIGRWELRGHIPGLLVIRLTPTPRWALERNSMDGVDFCHLPW